MLAEIFGQFDFKQFISAFVVLFAIIDIIGTLPIVINLQHNGRIISASRASIISLIFAITKLTVLSLISESLVLFFSYRLWKTLTNKPEITVPHTLENTKKQMLFGDESEICRGHNAVILSSRDPATNQDDKKAVALNIDTALQSRLKKFCAQPRVKGHFGLYVYDLTANKPVTAVDIDHAQPIASCTKLLASVAALNKLGADYTYRTTLYTRGKVEKDTLRGDIMLMAGLDPMLKAEDLTIFTRHLHRMGIRYIDGRCLLNLKLKEKVKAEQHWYPWDLSFSSYGILFKGPDAISTAIKRALAASGIRMKGDCELGAPSSATR